MIHVVVLNSCAEAKAIIDRQVAEAKVDEPRNLEEQALSLAGRDVYEKLVKGYTEKQWGRDCTELPAFIIRRLPMRFTFDNNYFNDPYQGIPVGGYTAMVEKILKDIPVKLGTDFKKEVTEENGMFRMGEDTFGKVLYTGLIDEYIVITNHKFAHIFETWASKKSGVKIRVIDDGTSSNETRLGAVKDILLAIEGGNKIVNGKLSNCKSLDDDLLVMAGDNLLDFSLGSFIRFAKEKRATCVMRYYEPDDSRLHKTGVAEIDADGLILSMEEKPAAPKSHWCIPLRRASPAVVASMPPAVSSPGSPPRPRSIPTKCPATATTSAPSPLTKP